MLESTPKPSNGRLPMEKTHHHPMRYPILCLPNKYYPPMCWVVFVSLMPLYHYYNNTTTKQNLLQVVVALYSLDPTFGSLAGAIGLPHVYYEASKHALEGLADGMRRGFQQQQQQKQQQNSTSTSLLRPVEVSLIKPGNIQTDMNRYGEVGPDQVTQVVLHALESNHPRHRYYPGTVKGMSSRFLCTVFDILPTWFTDKLL
jgi:hypothetical protein